MIQEVNNVAPMLQGKTSKTAQIWKRACLITANWKRARRLSHEEREAMLKFGACWEVQRKEQGKKRQPAEVAKDLEARMHENANALLTSSFVRPVTQNNSSSREASALKSLRTSR